MARRPIESQLYRELVDSGFRFIERGTREINEIYNAVNREYSNLCDDEYSCAHYRSVGLHQAEWKHVVRGALNRSKSIYENIVYSGRRGYWIFS
jgi:hypothetical protein